MDIDMSGFEGPAKKPLGNVPLRDGGEFIKPGQITSIFRLLIPPNGACEVVDTQHNRERLRVLTRPQEFYDEIQVYDEQKGIYEPKRVLRQLPPSFTVLDGTPIDEDIIQEQKMDSDEVQALKARIKELEAGRGIVPAGTEAAPEEKKEARKPEEKPELLFEEDEPDEKPLTGEALKKARFAKKVPMK